MATVAENLRITIEGWSAALAADAASPQPSYSISTAGGGSRTVDRNAWRKFLLESIREAQELLNIQEPYFTKTRQFL